VELLDSAMSQIPVRGLDQAEHELCIFDIVFELWQDELILQDPFEVLIVLGQKGLFLELGMRGHKKAQR